MIGCLNAMRAMRCAALAAGVLFNVTATASAVVPEEWVLRNDHLIVTFKNSEAGPRLSHVRHGGGGPRYQFQGVQEIALAIVPNSAVNDPDLRVSYRLQDGFRFEEAAVANNGARATFRFAAESVQADVTYELQPGRAVLRKTVSCTARQDAAYVAGVSLWILTPEGSALAWPKRDTYGQPAVLLADRGGCFLTVEWPRAHLSRIKDEIRMGYRPGEDLRPGETREVAAGSMGFFEARQGSQEKMLRDARDAFFAHVADRVNPKLPFPVKFTTWGPWLGQARADRILEVMDDLADVGVDLLHFDAGWQQPDHPYSKHFARVRDGDTESWDRAMTQPERLPNGLLPIVRAAKKRGMAVSLWLDACGSVFVREGDEWAIRDKAGKPVTNRSWEGRWGTLPRQSLASEYGDRLSEFALQALDRYDLGGIMFDNNHYGLDYATNRRSLANGWNAIDVQFQQILGILDEAERRRPGIYRFLCMAQSWPWSLLHTTHIHARDPGMTPAMVRASATDHPARALAYERRLAWRQHYDNFVPPWGVKGDIAGWSVQQQSPIPVNLSHTGQLIPSGEGWTQNMFTCFATTAVRDIRFSFRQMPAFDRGILKEWLAWDQQRTYFIFNCRPLFASGDDPNLGVDGFSHVGDGRGVIYLFNRSFDRATAEVTLDEDAGFRPQDKDVSAHLVYPAKAPLGSGQLSFGQKLRVPLIGKDCAIIEVGLERPQGLGRYADYERAVRSVRRSFDTQFLTDASEIFEAVRRGPVHLEVGSSVRDRRLASQICDTLGALRGRRVSPDELTKVAGSDAACRLIVGSHEGLKDHPEIGKRFRETLYNRYVEWDDMLISAPLAASLPETQPRAFCLIAPRPEQLARLATNLTSALLEDAEPVATAEIAEPVDREVSFQVNVPAGRTALQFVPVVSQHGHVTVPGDLQVIRFQIEAECDGKRIVLWSQEVPPFCGPRRVGDKDLFASTQWWRDRVVSVSDFAGKNVTFHLTAKHIDGRGHPQLTIGFSRVMLVGLADVSK